MSDWLVAATFYGCTIVVIGAALFVAAIDGRLEERRRRRAARAESTVFLHHPDRDFLEHLSLLFEQDDQPKEQP